MKQHPAKVITTDDFSQAINKEGFTITVDLNQCISAGPCAVAAPLTFFLREGDGKAIIVDPDAEDIELIRSAASYCPVLAIMIRDKNGKQIFP